jgi:hypothetical protein
MDFMDYGFTTKKQLALSAVEWEETRSMSCAVSNGKKEYISKLRAPSRPSW